jgi:hypothetical protein
MQIPAPIPRCDLRAQELVLHCYVEYTKVQVAPSPSRNLEDSVIVLDGHSLAFSSLAMGIRDNDRSPAPTRHQTQSCCPRTDDCPSDIACLSIMYGLGIVVMKLLGIF